MPKFRKESELVAPVAAYFRRRGYAMQSIEVPFYYYRIDFYGYSKRDSLSVALELKLTNWRRALEQAIIYQLTADLVYVALPREVVTSEIEEALSVHGIGLIGVGATGRCQQVLAAHQSVDVRTWYRDHFVSLLSKGESWVPCNHTYS